MPRFFFEIEVDDVYPDQTGHDLPDREAARAHAIDIATSHLHESRFDADSRKVRILIKDEAGETLDTLLSYSD